MIPILRVRDKDGNVVDVPAIIGPQGPAGKDGESGVYIGDTAPTNENVNVWLRDTDSGNTLNFISPPSKAEVGQFLQVDSVDEDGKPITWKTSELPIATPDTLGGGGGNKYRLIVELVVDEDNQAKSYLFTQDNGGNPFSLSKIVINYDIKANSNRADGYLTIAEKLIPYVASVETSDYYGVCEAEIMGDVLKEQTHMSITGTFFSVGRTMNYIPPIDANKTIDTIRLHSGLPYPIGSTFKIYGY